MASRRSMRLTRRPPNTQCHGNRTRSWRRGTAIRCPSIPKPGPRLAQGRIAGLFGISPRRSISAARFWAALRSKGMISGRRFSHHGGPTGWQAGQARAAPRPDVRVRWAIARPPARRFALAPTATVRLTAIDHHVKRPSSTSTISSSRPQTPRNADASPAIATSHEVVRIDTGTPMFMRGPPEATGSIALESAIDEMAQACGMDPLAFRLKTMPKSRPISGNRSLEGAARVLREEPSALAGRAARWQHDRCVTRLGPCCLGNGHGNISGADARSPGPCGYAQRRSGLMETGLTTWSGRLYRARPDCRRRAGARTRRGRVQTAHPTCRTRASPAAPPTRQRLARQFKCGRRGHRQTRGSGGRTTTARPCSAAAMAGVIARGGRLFRRDDETSQRELCRYPRPRRLTEIEARGKSAADPCAQSTYACMRTERCSPR